MPILAWVHCLLLYKMRLTFLRRISFTSSSTMQSTKTLLVLTLFKLGQCSPTYWWIGDSEQFGGKEERTGHFDNTFESEIPGKTILETKMLAEHTEDPGQAYCCP